MIGIAIALIVVSFAAMVAMVYSQGNTVRRIEETQLRQIGADTTAQKMIDQRIDNIITVHNGTVDRYDERLDEKDDEVKMIISRLDQIVADIAELNKENISDHRDLVDIRQRYILYRKPAHPNGGYTGGFVCKDDQDEQEEEHEQNDTETGR